jgi:hypothetical protein
MMWDSGTEVDQEPGIGSDQGPRQKAPNTGKAENGVVHKVQDSKMYSQASSVMHITITPQCPRCNYRRNILINSRRANSRAGFCSNPARRHFACVAEC